MAKTKSRKNTAKRAKARNGNGEKRSRPAFGAKSEFVRARPNKTAQEIVAEAGEHGLPLTVGHVYNIRALDKKKGGATALVATRVRAPQPGGDVERELRTIVARIGLDRAEAIFAEVRAAFSGASPAASPSRRGRVGRAPQQASSDSGTLTTEQTDAAA